MLAVPATAPPDGDRWAFEIKWDGVRTLAFVDAAGLRLCSRRGEDTTHRYPELAAAAERLDGRELVLDGEVVALDEHGRPSFQSLQPRMGLSRAETIRRRAAQAPVNYVAFDLLGIDGESLLEEPYERRRELLAGIELDARTEGRWRAPGHHIGGGKRFLAATREQGLEGIVCKRLGSPYRPGKRSPDWLKLRARRGQELVIGGYLPGEGGRRGRIGSLLVGYWDASPEEASSLGRPQRFVYAGGVGTGFTEAMLDRLIRVLEPLRTEEMPFDLGEDPRQKYRARARERGAGPVWVSPELVGDFEFTEWTREGTLRQPAFKGLREDKDARDVVREP